MSLLPFAKVLIIIGLTFLITGILLFITAKMFLPFFHLPGDLIIERENFRCIFALGTSILISILLTVGVNVVIHLLNRLK